MTEHAVVIAGGGPTGLTLAAELKLAGVDAVVVERRTSQALAGSRAGGLHARTIEVFDQRGIAARFLAAGQVAQVAGFAWIPLDIADFPSRHPYGLALWQNDIERILADWAEALGVSIQRGRDVTGATQDETGVTVALADGTALRAAYVVGCDGGRSIVRKSAGIDFPGWDATISHLIAEVELAEEPPWGMRRDAHGTHGLSKMADGKTVRVMVTEPAVGRKDEPTLDDLRATLAAIYGSDFGVHNPTWISRFTDMARQAAAYRAGRVLLAGDAAHIHYPTGGQGLNLGVQDAMNLGWKLAQVVRGSSPERLLDTYHAERHPIAAQVLRDTMAQVALLRADDQTTALREIVADVLSLDAARQRLGGRMSGLDVHYDLGEGHPLVGRRMPDLDLVTADGVVRVFTFLHAARWLLLDLAGHGGAAVRGAGDGGADGGAPLDLAPWADRVQRVVARTDGPWTLPVLGAVPAPTAVLVRPDGYVAWVGDGSGVGSGVAEALGRWVGGDAGG